MLLRVFKADGTVIQGRNSARKGRESLTEEAAAEPRLVAKAVATVQNAIEEQKSNFRPAIEFQDLVFSSGGATTAIAHNFGGRVRWWVVDWVGAMVGPSLVRHADSDANRLVLASYVAGTGSIRVEAA